MMEKEKIETWYDKSLEQVEKHFSTDHGKGLTRSAATKARREHGYNNVYSTPERFSLKRLIPTDYASLILLATALIAMIFDLPVAAGTIITLLIINYAAALFTYFKAQKVLDGMTEYSLPTAKVMRNSKLMLVDCIRRRCSSPIRRYYSCGLSAYRFGRALYKRKLTYRRTVICF